MLISQDLAQRVAARKFFFIAIFLACLVAVLAFFQRIEPIHQLYEIPEKYRINGEPLLTNLDGYFYLAAAKEVAAGDYGDVEIYRGYPDTVKRRPVPPLLSVILAFWHKLTGISLNWAGVFFSPAFSLLVAVPIFFLGNRWGGPAMALMAVSLTLLSSFSAGRNGFGALDTDCLNAFFAVNAVCLALLFANAKRGKRYGWLAAGLLNYLFFLWWWDQSFAAPTVLGLGPLAIAILLYIDFRSREGLLLLAAVFTIFILLGLVAGFSIYPDFFKDIYHSLSYISKQQHLYPNIGESISEQGRLSLGQLAKMTVFLPAFLHLSILGLIWLSFREKKEMAICLPLIIVGLFAVFFAKRFALFSVPMVALGFAGFLCLTAELFGRRNLFLGRSLQVLGLCLCIYICFSNYSMALKRAPIYHGKTVSGMQLLGEITEPGSVVWNFWNAGHPLVYWAKRRTIGDGMIHGGQRDHCAAYPLTLDDDRLAANYMQLYLGRGVKGVQDFYAKTKAMGLNGERLLPLILAKGPEKGLELLSAEIPEEKAKALVAHLFPVPERALYLFLTNRMVKEAMYWIYYNGSWDVESGSALKFLQTVMIALPPKKSFTGLPNENGFTVDDTLQLTLPMVFMAPVPLSGVTLTTASGSRTIHRTGPYQGPIMPLYQEVVEEDPRMARRGDYHLDLAGHLNKAIIHDSRVAKSLMARLFWRIDDYDKRFFEPVRLNTPHYQIWRVRGDLLR